LGAWASAVQILSPIKGQRVSPALEPGFFLGVDRIQNDKTGTMAPDDIFELTIAEASKCVAEGGIRPKVAALATADAEILGSAFRGETEPGDHAEFALLQKKGIAATRFAGATIYTTLEPCTVRGPGKTPCAKRFAGF
jgi:pyrimidine deaminase RibD-like protein